MAQGSTVAARVAELAAPIAVRYGVELVDVEYRREGGRWYLRLFIDKPGGVGLDDCEAVSNAISPVLDEEDFIPQSYFLEVSSPGLERPLKKPSDFERFRGRKVKMTTYTPVNGRKKLTGVLTGHDEEYVHLEVDGQPVSIPWNSIAGTRLVFE